MTETHESYKLCKYCSNPVHGRGLCRPHYMREWRYGDATVIKRVIYPTTEARFWAQVDKDGPNGCWLWTGALNTSGYGHINIDGKMVMTHIYSYKLVYPEYIPNHIYSTLDHTCRVTNCCNPTHLEAVTLAENVLRGSGPCAINARKTHCIRGHEFTPENTYIETTGSRRCIECRRTRNAR